MIEPHSIIAKLAASVESNDFITLSPSESSVALYLINVSNDSNAQQWIASPADAIARAIAICEARIRVAEEQEEVARTMGLDMAFGCWSGVAACARSIADELIAKRQ